MWIKKNFVRIVGVGLLLLLLATLILPGTGSRSGARRSQTANRQRNLSLAIQAYATSHKGQIPEGGKTLQNGMMQDSWATELLPYLDQGALYTSINHKVVWDEPQNHQSMSAQIEVFYTATMTKKQKSINGFGTIGHSANVNVMGKDHSMSLDEISRADGASQTIMLGQINSNFPAWGDPANYRDPNLGINKNPDGFGGPQGVAAFSFCDGSCRYLNENINPDVLKALSTPNGGEEISSVDF